MKRYLLLLFSFLVIVPTAVSSVYADDQNVFGRQSSKIVRSHFCLLAHKFTLDDPGDRGSIIPQDTPDKGDWSRFILLNREAIPLWNSCGGDDLVYESDINLHSPTNVAVFLKRTPVASIAGEDRSSGGFIPPSMVSIEANPEAIHVGAPSTLSWRSKYAQSAFIDRGIGEAPANASIAVTGPGGTATASVTVAVTSALTLNITSPFDGATISRPDVMVRGTVTHPNGNETGVTVNGVIAMVDGDQFVANHVPLWPGRNTLTADAIDTDGNRAIRSVTVNWDIVENNRDFISIKADTESCIPPLETTLRIEGAFSFTESSLSYTGPGEIEILEHPSPEEYGVRMTAEGLYYVTAEVIDPQGDIYRDTIAIHVLNIADLDALLRSKWNRMRSALIAGDIEEALLYHHEVLKDKYEAIYNLLRANLPSLAQQMQDIELIYAEDTRAKYRIRRDHEINGKIVAITYYLYFSRDENGLWKIERY
jgi:hypothetical protein